MIGRIVIEHQDRGTRFGFRYIQTLLKTSGWEIEVVNPAENSAEDLMADLTSIVYSCCAKLSRQRRAQHTTDTIVHALEQESHEEAQEAD